MCEGYEVYFTEDTTDNCDIKMRGTFEVTTGKKEPMLEGLNTALGAGKHTPHFLGYMDMEVTVDYSVGGSANRKTYNKSLTRKYMAREKAYNPRHPNNRKADSLPVVSNDDWRVNSAQLLSQQIISQIEKQVRQYSKKR